MLRFAQICISLKNKYVWFLYFFWFTGMGEVEITILHSCFAFYRRNFPKLTFWFSWLLQCAMTWTIQAITTRESGLLLFLPLKSLGKVTIGKLEFFGRSGFPPHSLTFFRGLAGHSHGPKQSSRLGWSLPAGSVRKMFIFSDFYSNTFLPYSWENKVEYFTAGDRVINYYNRIITLKFKGGFSLNFIS